MLLIIHNLPHDTRYSDIKALIKEKCGLTEMIVDNLMIEGKGKKVTVGLADEGDAAILVRKINGLYLCNQQLYVEDVRQQKSNEQPYRPSNEYSKDQYRQSGPPQFNNQYYGQGKGQQLQIQPSMNVAPQMSPGPSQPNFGMPFYMTSQNQNVGNIPQPMVQYPNVQGSGSNEPNEGRDTGFDQQFGSRKSGQTVSPDRGAYRDRSPGRLSRWNDSDYGRSDGREGRERPNRRDDERSYRDNSSRDSFQSTSNQDYGSNQNKNKFKKPVYRPEMHWVNPNNSMFSKQNKPYNAQDRPEREQKFMQNTSNQFRGPSYASQSGAMPKKRPYDSTDKNLINPPSKKFANNQQFQRQKPAASGSCSSNKYQNKNNTFSNKFAVQDPMQQKRPYMPPKELQSNKPQWQQNNQPFKQSKKQDNLKKKNVGPNDFEKATKEDIARLKAWRVQASAVIASQVLKNLGKKRNKRDPLFIALKACVRARIDVIIDDNMSWNLKKILSYYRGKFQDDKAFYNTVLEKFNKGELTQVNEIESGKKATKSNTDNLKSEDIASSQSSVSADRLPKYPEGNKKVMSKLKQVQKEEVLNESLYNLDAEDDKALTEELDVFGQLMRQEIADAEFDTEMSIYKFMNDLFVPEMLKVLNLHVKKRILDIRTNLAIRVIFPYKAPKKDTLHAFLKNYGVISLKPSQKSRNVNIGVCDSYDSYDAICKLGSAMIDGVKISFKPLHITGPPNRTKRKKQSGKTAGKTENNNENDVVANEIDGTSANEEKSQATGKLDNINNEVMENDTDCQEIQPNEYSECEFNPSDSSQDTIESKKLAVIEKKDDYTHTDDNKGVVSLDEPTKFEVDSHVDDAGNEGVEIKNQSATVTDNVVTDAKETVTNDVERIAKEHDVKDNDKETVTNDDLRTIKEHAMIDNDDNKETVTNDVQGIVKEHDMIDNDNNKETVTNDVQGIVKEHDMIDNDNNKETVTNDVQGIVIEHDMIDNDNNKETVTNDVQRIVKEHAMIDNDDNSETVTNDVQGIVKEHDMIDNDNNKETDTNYVQRIVKEHAMIDNDDNKETVTNDVQPIVKEHDMIGNDNDKETVTNDVQPIVKEHDMIDTDNNKETATNDVQGIVKELDMIDNDNIVEDDLEDF